MAAATVQCVISIEPILSQSHTKCNVSTQRKAALTIHQMPWLFDRFPKTKYAFNSNTDVGLY